MIANLQAPLDAKVVAARYLAQAMKLSREPGSTVVGMKFSASDGILGAEFVEQQVANKKEIEASNMEHGEKMDALAPGFAKLSRTVDYDSAIEFVLLGSAKGKEGMEEVSIYLGKADAEWRA